MTACSSSCGGGTQTGKLLVTNTNGNSTCPVVPAPVQNCNTQACPQCIFTSTGTCSATACGTTGIYTTQWTKSSNSAANCIGSAPTTPNTTCIAPACPPCSYGDINTSTLTACSSGSQTGELIVTNKNGNTTCPVIKRSQSCYSGPPIITVTGSGTYSTISVGSYNVTILTKGTINFTTNASTKFGFMIIGGGSNGSPGTKGGKLGGVGGGGGAGCYANINQNNQILVSQTYTASVGGIGQSSYITDGSSSVTANPGVNSNAGKIAISGNKFSNTYSRNGGSGGVQSWPGELGYSLTTDVVSSFIAGSGGQSGNPGERPGGGATAQWGGGTTNINSYGNSATKPGCGGGGGASTSTAGYNGGSGTPGIVYIWYAKK